MRRTRFRAMGTTFDAAAVEATGLVEAERMVRDAEARFSRFLPDSELSELNRRGGAVAVRSPEFLDLLAAAERARSLSEGLVTIGIGASIIDWGYDAPFDPNRQGVKPVPDTAASVEWHLDGSLLHMGPGTRLDVGGIAKGWICDRVVEGGGVVMLSGGGDLRSAEPTCVVNIMDPWGELATSIRVGVGALATSSVTRRAWMTDAGPAHHLIDPRTGRPADSPVLSATVVTESALEAEVGAKCVLLHGEDGLAWASGQPWIRSAMVVWHDGSVYGTGSLRIAS